MPEPTILLNAEKARTPTPMTRLRAGAAGIGPV